MIQSEIRAAIEFVDPRGAHLAAADVALLQAIQNKGSVAQAARDCATSYRRAWGRIAEINAWAGRPWVRMERGRGAALSPECSAVLASLSAIEAEMKESLERAELRLNQALAGIARRHRRGLRWRLSHDLLIEKALQHMAAEHAPGLDAKFGGSLNNLEALALGDCELAGFHVPGKALHARLTRLAAAYPGLSGVQLVHLMDRTQGLMVAPGNPKRIRRIADLARRGVRFINRQKNSGSRELLDALLKAEGLAGGRIVGYAHEEFTHFAVAAAVASGAADVGLGIEAAARQLGLDFVALTDESYFIAGRADALGSAECAEVLDWFRGGEAAGLASQMGGYVLHVIQPDRGF